MKYILLSALVVLSVFSTSASGQDCKPPAIIFNANADNMFTPEQEMFLGDAMMERVEKDYRVLDDAEINAFLQSIGDRIAKHLPPTGIKFRFVVADTSYTNAHAMAGGRIFVTRKMISFVRNEDELAGVIAHELGHAVVRHHAIDMSRYFKAVLGVTSVGDRNDVFDKYNKLLERFRTAKIKVSNNHEDNQQIEADRIGVYAAYAAGYDPNAFTEFWKRFTDAKKGNFFNDLFGSKTPADKRLREMIAAMKQIPAACLDKLSPTASQDFERWRSLVINYTPPANPEALNGLLFRRTLVPLRSDITHLRFSPDGKYLIAQDASTVTVLTREPLAVAFRVELEEAFPAVFSRDSKTLIAYTKKLRVQKWDLESKSIISTHEVAIRDGYWQTRVSPDGKYLACYRYNGDLLLYDIATNTEVYKKKEFFLPDYFEYLTWQLSRALLDMDEYPAINIEFSPDGKYFLAGRRSRTMQITGTLGGIFPTTINRDETLAVDLATRKEVDVSGNIGKLLISSMDFMGADKVVGQYSGDIKKSGIFAFPSGERIDQFELSGATFTPAESGGYISVRPVSGAAVGVYDLKAKKYILANKKSALDVFGDVFVAERRNGEIGLYAMGTNQLVRSVNLPASPLATLRASALSPDGKWLTISDRSRGAAWNLQTGERILHIRSFRGSHFIGDGKVYADFPKQDDTARSIAVMDLNAASVTAVGNVSSEDSVRQHGPFMVVRKSNQAKKDTAVVKQKDEEKGKEKENEAKKKDEQRRAFREEEPEKGVPGRATTLEMRDVVDGKTLWTRKFDNETPSYFLDSEEERIVFYWAVGTAAAKEIIAGDPGLTAKVALLKEKTGDRLFQFVDARTGAIRGHFLLETGEGSIDVSRISSSGDYLVVGDSDNRLLVYSISSGELLYRFFGTYSATAGAGKKIAVENLPGRVSVFDLTTGREIERLSFARPITRMSFLDDGRKFFVLTSDQTVFMFDTSKFALLAAR